MATARNALRMTRAEVAEHLDTHQRVQVATTNPDGSIHLVPMSYFLWEGKVALWTDPNSRKVKNLRRDPSITCLVEAGDAFEEFRAVQLRGRAELIEGQENNRRAGELLFSRSRPELTDELRAYAAMLAAQRVTVVVTPRRIVSWDHRKLSGVRPDEIGS